MNQQLTISQVVNLPGVQFTRNSLVFAAQLADEAIPEIGRRIHLIRGFSKWAMGAVLAEMIRRRDADETWANEFTAAIQMDPKERREILGVHTFFPPPARTINLSYEHYREAMWGVADGKPEALRRALDYLRRARDGDWSLSQLRLTIRREQATEQPDAPTQADLDLARYGAVFTFRAFAAAELPNAATLTPERAQMILSDLGDAPKYIDALRERAAADPTPGQGTS